jgi:hypothetical protein
MAAKRNTRVFGAGQPSPPGGKGQPTPAPSRQKKRSTGAQAIPEAVANRMARRIALATGLPSLMGMAVFVGSYFLVSRHVLDIPPSATLLASGSCFLLGVLGLSYGVLSASWEEIPGSLLGQEQIGVNISRIRASLQALRQGSGNG